MTALLGVPVMRALGLAAGLAYTRRLMMNGDRRLYAQWLERR